jgi:hypothetical protein
MPRPDGGWENQLKFAGLDLELLSCVNADQQITLDCRFNWSEKDFNHVVTFRDALIPGIRSRSLCTKIQMNSRETVVLRGLVVRGLNPSLPDGEESAAQETEFACLITSEIIQPNPTSLKLLRCLLAIQSLSMSHSGALEWSNCDPGFRRGKFSRCWKSNDSRCVEFSSRRQFCPFVLA